MSEKKAKAFFTYTCTVRCCADCPNWSRFNRHTIDETADYCYCTIAEDDREIWNPDILPSWCPNRGC